MSTALFRQDNNRIVDSILQGDALTVLRTLPDNHVQTVVTSPPYYSLRDYGVDGQIGLESSPDEFIAKLVEVFREVKRVLRENGTLWLNIGDSYADSMKGIGANGKAYGGPKQQTNKGGIGVAVTDWSQTDLKNKDLIGIPWMLAFALRADGWYLRMDCIWHKPNCMPESVKDRPTKSHEYLFLLSKGERYYYDSEAIKEPNTGNMPWGMKRKAVHGPEDMKHGGMWSTRGNLDAAGSDPSRWSQGGRNKRSVWTIPTQPYKNAHFATMPQKLVEPCVLAGSSPQACEHCGAPWKRETTKIGEIQDRRSSTNRYADEVGGTHRERTMRNIMSTTGWQPTCTCPNEGMGKSIVLDPFAGAGTVPLVAAQHERHYLGIELNPEYVEMAERRIQQALGLWEAV